MEVPTKDIEPAAGLREMNTLVHDLCQPITTLQCRMELAQILGTFDEYREAVESGVVECARLARHVHALRDLLRSMLSEPKSED